MDGTEYAVKKIPIRSEGIQSVRNYLSEVKTFASMNHPNIVQYKGAWLEIGAPSVKHSVQKIALNSEQKVKILISSYNSITCHFFTHNPGNNYEFTAIYVHLL